MPIVGAYIFPHGTITLDPETRDFTGIQAVTPQSKEKCIKLHNAMRLNAASLVENRPDIIIFSTPHGLKLTNSVLLLGNSKAQGTAAWDGNWQEFTSEFNIDVDNSISLAKTLTESGNPVELLQVGKNNINEDTTLPLCWSEVVPWWFINQAAEKADFELPPVIFIGQPTKGRGGALKMIPELLKFGGDIFRWIQSDENIAKKKIAFVVSSDLSHCHSSDPGSPFEFSEFATVFDGFVAVWASIERIPEKEAESHEKIVTMAGGLVDHIQSCGYTGLVTLHGFLSAAVSAGLCFQGRLLHYSAPTYYGMMVNCFILPPPPQ